MKTTESSGSIWINEQKVQALYQRFFDVLSMAIADIGKELFWIRLTHPGEKKLAVDSATLKAISKQHPKVGLDISGFIFQVEEERKVF